MNRADFQIRIDGLIRHYRTAILGTLLAHAVFLMLLVLFEVSRPEISSNNEITLELEQDPAPLTETELSPVNNGNNDNKDLKNIEANEGDQNKSFDDYYREAQDMVNHSSSKESFKANDYNDLRNLAKDYTKDYQVNINDDNNKKQTNQSSTSSNSNSKNTYAGNTVISYNLGGRKASRLPVPAYQCLGSGEVNIEINVNQKGLVTSVTVLSAKTSLNEDCLTEAASIAARKSRFAIDLKAPASQKGTINYKFIQQ